MGSNSLVPRTQVKLQMWHVGSAFQGEAGMWVLVSLEGKEVKGWVPADGGGLASTPIPKESLLQRRTLVLGGLFVRRQVCVSLALDYPEHRSPCLPRAGIKTVCHHTRH